MHKGTVIWLVLLTAYVGYQDFAMLSFSTQESDNLEIRKQKFENISNQFKSLGEYINGPLNERITYIETYIENEVHPYLHEH